MDSPAFSLTPRPAAVLARLQNAPGAHYWAAAVLVLLALGVRLMLSSAMGNGYGYTCFYPAVILAAYWLGAQPALMAAGLSTAIVYAFLGPVPLHWNMDGRGLVAQTFFLLSSALLIHILSTIRARFNLPAANPRARRGPGRRPGRTVSRARPADDRSPAAHLGHPADSRA